MSPSYTYRSVPYLTVIREFPPAAGGNLYRDPQPHITHRGRPHNRALNGKSSLFLTNQVDSTVD